MSLNVDDDVSVRLERVPSAGPVFDSVVALGDKCRGTLGFFPRAAFADKAAEQAIVGALAEDELIGYVAFDLTRRYIRLIHVCVDPAWRGFGIARKLVSYIRREYGQYPGILARCRNDYELAPMWINLGFRPLKEITGRSHDGRLLTIWWLDHGHPTLFTELSADPLLRAALDLCIVRDLSSDTDRPEAMDSKTLIADHVTDRLQLLHTPVLSEEIATLEDSRKRQACIRFTSHMQSVELSGASEISAIEQRLIRAAQRTRANYPADKSDVFDVRHVAVTAAAGVNVFVTRDENLIKLLSEGAAEYGVRILTPTDVIVHLDELAAADMFRPVALAGTSLNRKRLGAGYDDEVKGLANQILRENPRKLLKIWRDAAAGGHGRFGVFDRDGRLIVAWVTQMAADTLQVPMLRVAHHRLADTLGRQLLFMLRGEARDNGLSVIAMTDPSAPRTVQAALAEDGFTSLDGAWYGMCLDICADSQRIEAKAVKVARQAGLPPPTRLRSGMPATAAALIERAWWPAKVIDAQMSCYLVPIQQRFSSSLFGLPASLLARDDELGLSREHVYYRAPKPFLDAPGRILWYMSGTGKPVLPQGVFACSQLDDVVVGTPEELHDRYQHLGVWRLDQLREASKEGKLQALRFSNTELFDPGVPLNRLKAFGVHITPGPRRIGPDLFADIYREGRDKV